MGRWSRPRVPRDERLCTKCSQSVVEDEFHVLFECPSYSPIRTKFQRTLFARFGTTLSEAVRQLKHVPGKVSEFMDQEPRRVARFVSECFQHRRYYRVYVACVRKLQAQSGQSKGAASVSPSLNVCPAAPTVHAPATRAPTQSSSTRKLYFIVVSRRRVWWDRKMR